MALIPCRECNRLIDDQAMFCPGCGVSQIPPVSKLKMERQATEPEWRILNAMTRGSVVGLLIGTAVLLVAVGLSYLLGSDEESTAATRREEGMQVFLLAAIIPAGVLLGATLGGFWAAVGRRGRAPASGDRATERPHGAGK